MAIVEAVPREEVLAVCTALPGAVEDYYPSGDGVAVFTIGGRMLALAPLADDPASGHLNGPIQVVEIEDTPLVSHRPIITTQA